jgi:hypothetical protein
MKSIWGCTAFWYTNPPQEADSRQNQVHPRLLHEGNVKGENGLWEDESPAIKVNPPLPH